MIEIILDEIPFQIDRSAFMQELRLENKSSLSGLFLRLIDEAQAIARPKAYYQVAAIEERGDDIVRIGGMAFSSRILSVNLEGVDQVYLYAATCGTELDEWSTNIKEGLHEFWANEIMGLALDAATKALDESITNRFDPGHISSMSPGSLEDWPLEEQRPLFALLGDLGDVIGIELLDNLWMTPAMSVSGVRFPSVDGFESCQLCPRVVCSERAAPYDALLYDRKYRRESN